MDVKGKQILVVGFGVSGQAAARLLVQKGAKVFAIDESRGKTMKRRAKRKKNCNLQIQFGVRTIPSGRFDAAILSPGVSLRSGLASSIADLDVPVYGELELASWFCQCPMIGITGTNGKTTTTQLVARALRANFKQVVAAGNIGLPLSEAALQSERLDYLVVEVSSFQLETIDTFRPRVSVMMNISPDHLDRYASVEEYARAKVGLWKNQCGNDWVVINRDTEKYLADLGFSSPVGTIRYSVRAEEDVDLWFDGKSIRGPIVEETGLEPQLVQTHLRGAHHAENVMATLAVVYVLKLSLPMAWKEICNYQPLAHRLETVDIFQGIEFVNDSKATNLDAMEKAIRTFTRPIILIAGGKNKGFDFSHLTSLIRENVKSCILIGEARKQLFQAWKEATSCVFADSLEEAVAMAGLLGKEGDVVLLSPGCSSYDMFENYEERGEVFRRAVRHLHQSKLHSKL